MISQRRGMNEPYLTTKPWVRKEISLSVVRSIVVRGTVPLNTNVQNIV